MGKASRRAQASRGVCQGQEGRLPRSRSSSAPWAWRSTFENTAAATLCAMCARARNARAGARGHRRRSPPAGRRSPPRCAAASCSSARTSTSRSAARRASPTSSTATACRTRSASASSTCSAARCARTPSTSRSARRALHAHIDEHWRAAPSVSPALKWSEIVTLAHNAAISDDERAVYGEWGADADEQRTRGRAERDDLYCGLPELIAAECLRGVGVDASLRVWRQVDGKLQVVTRVTSDDGGAAVGRRAAAARRARPAADGAARLGVGALQAAGRRKPARWRAQAGRGGAGRQPQAESSQARRKSKSLRRHNHFTCRRCATGPRSGERHARCAPAPAPSRSSP